MKQHPKTIEPALEPEWRVIQNSSQDNREFALIALNRGWQIHSTSCACGGNYAWYYSRRDEPGVEWCHGCICHRSLSEFYYID